MAAVIPPSPAGTPFGSQTWADWYEKVRRAINEAAEISWTQLTNFTGSNLTDLETRNHNDLQTLQGGTTNEFYHLTAAEDTALAAGYTGSVTLAKITPGGTNGSLTVSHGIITAYTAPT
jgi:hypothetical protein